ncbi:unnamed protein product [Rhizoctonia solani]|uniref:Zn(2)-C6 fungal-type domain-containing protein n=1 Tax=Rhizoctonia solani TaxID=456999 RepID=A0A8H3G956_9AGAM|nr:unnamed protein product [Rhizoctonia solani]
MASRSNTGCHRCKTWRKKCDEMKPTCLRCKNGGMECRYEYFQGPGKKAKLKTRPGPRPVSEQVLKPEPQQSNSTSFPKPEDNARNRTELFDYSPNPMLPLALNTCTGQNSLVECQLMSLNSDNIGAFPSAFMASQYPISTQNSTFSQGNLLKALFSPNETIPLLQSNPPPLFSVGETYFPPHETGLHSMSRNNPDSPPYAYAPVSTSKLLDEEEDLDGVKEIFYLAPLRLDWTLEANSLSFILQSYGQWIHATIFEPLKILYQTKEGVINQLSQSSASRSRLILTSHLMRTLAQSWTLDEAGKRVLGLLRGEVLRNVANYAPQECPASEAERGRAYAALNHMLEVISLQINSIPLSFTLNLLETAVPVFQAACHPHPNMLDILLEGGINLRNFVAMDVATSFTTGRSLFCRYHAPWSLDLCNQFAGRAENRGSQWLLGIPDQFVLLLGYIDGLKKDAEAAGTSVDPGLLSQIEHDVRKIHVSPSESNDPSLVVGRMVVQECWREAVILYTYMALGGAHAFDPRVIKSHLGFMRLVKGTKPARNPDAFLVIPMIAAGVAATKSSHRRVIISRILSVPECTHPNTAGNELVLTLKEAWARAELERRPPRWDDLREACRRITGV